VKSRLKVLRAEKGWSQGDLAERAEVSRQTINAIETEKYEPSLSLAFRLAAIFEVSIESLFQPDRDPGHQKP
jgi:putative transcriptional regulator